MSRVSDTRLRTRQAAAKLVASGRRPHALTVDLIYAEIRQGSRTTINDELKLWKDEQAKVDALSAALPAPVANAMLAAWAVAVEHGESVFDQRREEVEAELAEASNRAETAEAGPGRIARRSRRVERSVGRSPHGACNGAAGTARRARVKGHGIAARRARRRTDKRRTCQGAAAH